MATIPAPADLLAEFGEGHRNVLALRSSAWDSDVDYPVEVLTLDARGQPRWSDEYRHLCYTTGDCPARETDRTDTPWTPL